MRQSEFLKRLTMARINVAAEISANASRSRFASGLSNEGYAGGYQQALDDVAAMLRHGHPNDPRSYWCPRPTKRAPHE